MLKRSALVPSLLLLRSRPAMALRLEPASPERCFVVESPSSDLVYFTLSSPRERLPVQGAPPRCFLPRPGRCYSFCVPAAPSPRERVRAARLHRNLQQSLSREPFSPRSKVLALLSYRPQEAALERGFLVQDQQRLPDTERALEELLRLLLPAPTHLSVYEAAEDGECISLIPEAKVVLDLVDRCPEHPKKGEFPVIVIEGLDATGKTTVTQTLKDSLNAVLLRTPPPCVSRWRKIFDDEPTLIRRAFYALTNYIVASEIAKESMKSTVIVDRYWHSTAAYAIASEVSGKVQNLPPLHHQVYHWPEDLLRPDVVLLLTISPEERIRRLQERGLEKTREEAELEGNTFFRQKVEESYRRMENPTCQPVDASPSREEVLKAALHVIKKHCHLL
ncbi:UMP-CMP kinase 2, mitochondrial isoform X2 [Elgaria multicarinata webbii]|uniref:UMP-CMP kinase 2, mitochondrial isoform X2 n=1 Tax=Elgaria multicarinata webbii TaxID=159646 RepID=UPI002FCD1A10